MKFINLLKKELSELINKQMLISLVFILTIFLLMGNVMKSATNEIVSDAANPKINICDMDDVWTMTIILTWSHGSCHHVLLRKGRHRSA